MFVCFHCEQGSLIRQPTPYPKEMREKARHLKNLALRQQVGTGARSQGEDNPAYDEVTSLDFGRFSLSVLLNKATHQVWCRHVFILHTFHSLLLNNLVNRSYSFLHILQISHYWDILTTSVLCYLHFCFQYFVFLNISIYVYCFLLGICLYSGIAIVSCRYIKYSKVLLNP